MAGYFGIVSVLRQRNNATPLSRCDICHSKPRKF